MENDQDHKTEEEYEKGVGSPARRVIVKALAAAGIISVPTHWTKPVVETVVLPVHAQMSPGPGSPDPEDNGDDGSSDDDSGDDGDDDSGDDDSDDDSDDDDKECTDEWTKSSLSFDGYVVCNTGDGPEYCASRYKIRYAERGNAMEGTVVAEGEIGPLGDDGCHDFESQLETLCGEQDGGKLKVQVFQHPGHPGTGVVWSEDYEC